MSTTSTTNTAEGATVLVTGANRGLGQALVALGRGAKHLCEVRPPSGPSPAVIRSSFYTLRRSERAPPGRGVTSGRRSHRPRRSDQLQRGAGGHVRGVRHRGGALLAHHRSAWVNSSSKDGRAATSTAQARCAL